MATKKEFTVTYTYIKTDDGTKMLKAPQFGGNYTEQEREELLDYVLDTEISLTNHFECPAAYSLKNAWESYKMEKELKKKFKK